MSVFLVTNIVPHYRQHLLKELVRKDLIQTILASSKDLKTIKKARVSITEVTNIRIRGYLFYQLGVIDTLLFHKVRTVIITAEVSNLTVWYTLLWGRLMNRDVILWGHGLYGREAFVLRSFRLLMHKLASHSLVYNTHAKILLNRFGISNVTVVYNSLEPLKSAAKKSFKNEHFTLVFAGRILRDRGIDKIIKALGLRVLKDVRLKIIGEGVYLSELKGIVKELYLEDRVDFRGALYGEQMRSELSKCHVVVSPDKIGLLAIESLSLGLPVITKGDMAHQGPEAEAIRDRVSGTFLRSSDLKELVRAIVYWKDKYERLGNLDIQIADEWSLSNQLSVFRQILADRKLI